jgi:hypothetical protein
MNVPVATTFDEYVAIMATNSPTATVLDCWRRLDRVLRDYGTHLAIPIDVRDRGALEAAIARDESLGRACASSVRTMRQRRNGVAHGLAISISTEDAIDYARQSFAVIGALAKRIAELEGAA